jgi:hypothetical protein
LAAPTVLGIIDPYRIELSHPMRAGRSPQQIGRKGLSKHRWIVGGKRCLLVNQWGGWWPGRVRPPISQRGAVYNPPVPTTASTYPIIGITGLRNLVAVVEQCQRQTLEEQGALCHATPFPPPVGPSALLVLGERLPPAKRHHLLGLLSQRRAQPLHATGAQGEDGAASASRP